MSGPLRSSWSAFTDKRARGYLKTEDAPSVGSKRLLGEVLETLKVQRVLDLGCGNGQLLEHFRAAGSRFDYVGVDFSEPLLRTAREVHAADDRATFVVDDVETLDAVEGEFDAAVYSHVLETLSSPELSLRAALRCSDVVVIRFFEPPEHDVDTVELREMDVGGEAKVPYLRRKMGRDFYRLMLARNGIRTVDVYRDETSTDQVHVLHKG